MKNSSIIVTASAVAALVLLFVLGAIGGFAGNGLEAWIHYYALDMAGSLAGFFYYAVLFVCVIVIMLVIWSLGGGFLATLFPRWRKDKEWRKNPSAIPRDFFIDAVRRTREVLWILPVILFVTLVALAMGEANEFARARLQDQRVIGFEHALFGQYVFAALGAIHYPGWLLSFIIFSFDNMALILIAAGVFLAYFARGQFRELIVAFCVGILIMVPLWLMVPVLSPQDRFINNIYKLPDPPALAAAVAEYHPQTQLVDFLQSVRVEKAGLPALPTSTMPSAHVFWATIAGYYLFRAKRWLRIVGWVALPFLIASTFGTVLLAQHYFMDVPVGMAVAVLAIWLAHDIEKDPDKKSIVAAA